MIRSNGPDDTMASETRSEVQGTTRPIPLRQGLSTWVKVAALSFGGPAGQIGVMHRLLVDERKWVGEERFMHAMSYCMLLPGPEAQQLATYLGWLLHGTRGGLIAGTLFILPGAVSIYALSYLYAAYGDTTWVQAVFYGIKPAVMAVVLEALLRIGGRTLHGRTTVLLAAVAFVAIFFLQVPFPLIVIAAALFGVWNARRMPPAQAPAEPVTATLPTLRSTAFTVLVWLTIWLAPVGLLVAVFGRDSVFVDQAVFFGKAAVVTFGGAYAVLAYMAQQAVEVYHWLLPGEMLDGLGLAETTPGPLIQVVQFVGYLGAYRHPGELSPALAGAVGSLVTTWVTFVPCFLFVFAGAPYAEFLRGRRSLDGALTGITAAVVGVILNLAVWFAVHTLFAEVIDLRVGPIRVLSPVWGTIDWMSLLLAAAAGVAMLHFRVGMLRTLACAATVGFIAGVLL